MVGLAGCQPAPVAPTPPQAAVTIATVTAPSHLGSTNIALVRQDRAVTVGMRVTEAFDIFRDAREGGFEDERLPAGFAPPYRARSWETSQRGFGVISYQDVVAAAMYQERDCPLDRLGDYVDLHTRRMNRSPDRQIFSKHLNYYFWEEDGQRLMILGFQKPGGSGVQLTMAMGDTVVMDAIGASIASAEREKERVDKLLVEPTDPAIFQAPRKG